MTLVRAGAGVRNWGGAAQRHATSRSLSLSFSLSLRLSLSVSLSLPLPAPPPLHRLIELPAGGAWRECTLEFRAAGLTALIDGQSVASGAHPTEEASVPRPLTSQPSDEQATFSRALPLLLLLPPLPSLLPCSQSPLPCHAIVSYRQCLQQCLKHSGVVSLSALLCYVRAGRCLIVTV